MISFHPLFATEPRSYSSRTFSGLPHVHKRMATPTLRIRLREWMRRIQFNSLLHPLPSAIGHNTINPISERCASQNLEAVEIFDERVFSSADPSPLIASIQRPSESTHIDRRIWL